ncbi:MAG: hypothetical protein NC517_05345 [Firmicutes bacterium]|nr:hypothetical protein [Bacillota bacterium]
MLNILWRENRPMTCSDIVAEKRELTQNTGTAVIRRLLDDGLIEVSGTTYCGRVLGRTYVPTPKSKEVLFQNFMELYDWFRDAIPPKELMERMQNVQDA